MKDILIRKSVPILILFWLSPCVCTGQEPFDCNGRIFRVLEEQGGTTFQEVIFDPDSEIPNTQDLKFFPNVKINGIAYHPTQNLIYGVLLGNSYRLCRIDAQYKLEIIRELPLPEQMLFVSGDVSPDERYLVLLGYSPDEATNIIALVDLTDPSFPTQLLQASTTDPETSLIYCADIAFHPTNGQLFGFDHLSGRLITIDLRTKVIDNTNYPPTEILRGNVPSIFFNARGELYGVGSPSQSYATNRNFYHFNVADGSVTLLGKLDFESNQDGCSCPYQVKLLNRVSTRRAVPCTELIFTFTLINRTDREQTNLTFRDTFPDYLRIEEIRPLPFKGDIVRGKGDHVLVLEGIDLPIGRDSFTVRVSVDPSAPMTSVENSAYLDGVIYQEETTPRTIPSDDPETPRPEDPTRFSIETLRVNFLTDQVFLCPNGRVELKPDLPNGLEYKWSTGVETPRLIVEKPGTYAVTVTTPCNEAAGSIDVINSGIKLELGPDLIVERGEAVELQPVIQSTSRISTFLWHSEREGGELCATCTGQAFTARQDDVVSLQVTDENGCSSLDALNIKIRPFDLFVPTAFSPNNDGINDHFFLQSRRSYNIRHFRIFDRWGSLLYARRDIFTNEAEAGWDGRSRNRMLRNGVYIWMAEVVNFAGDVEIVKGEVSLIR